MRETDYAYAVARIRCNELKLLTKSDMEQLLNQPDAQSCIKRLTDKGYGRNGVVYSNERELLKAESESAWELINEIAPDKSNFDSLKVGNDYHNLKAVLESFILGQSYENLMLYPVTVEPSVMHEAFKTRDFSLLSERMAAAAQEAYTVMVEERDSQRGEAIIDKACMEDTLARAKGCGEVLEKLAEHKIVTTDIKIAMRCALTKKPMSLLKASLAECDKLKVTELAAAAVESPAAVLEYLASNGYEDAAEKLRESMSAFEKWCDEKMRDIISPAKYRSLGPDPLAAYLVAKELEIRSARIILSGKRNGVNSEKLRARLRELY